MLVGVSGAQGFIGGWVVDELISKGHQVVVVDHLVRERDERPEVETMLADVRDRNAMVELAAHVDGVIHLAAILGTQETIKNPHPAAEVNILGGLNVLTACDQYDIPLVNICVGNYWMLNTYSSTKNCFERLCDMYRKEHNAKIANVRCVNAYGPRQRAAAPFAPGKVRKIAPAFICRALSGMPVEIYGDGEQVSDMVYVGDVARTLVRALESVNNGIIPSRTIEVGPEQSATVNQVAQAVIDECMMQGHDAVEIVHLPMRPGENAGDKVTADPQTLWQVGIDPDSLVGLSEGIFKTVEYFEDTKGITWNAPPSF